MAAELEAAVAYVTFLGDGSHLQKDTERAVKKVKAPEIVARIDAQLGDLEKKVTEAKARLADLKKQPVDPEARLKVTELMRRADEAKARLDELNKAGPDPQIGLDIRALQARAQVVDQKIRELRALDASPEVDAQIAKFQAEAGRVETRIAKLQELQATAHIQARVDGEAEVERLKREIDEVAGAHDAARLQAEVRGQQEVDALEAKITALRGQRAQVQIDADTSFAAAQLRFFEAQVDKVDGKRADVHVGATGVGDTAAKLILLAAAAGAAAGALPAVASVAAAGAGGLAALGQGALAAIAGLSGISDAVQATEADQKSAATSASSAASTQASAARQVASAARGLQQAQTQQTRTAIQGNASVASAARSLQSAQTAAYRASIQGAEQVASAQRALAQAQISAMRSVQDAQLSYTRAVQAERYAQEDVTRARKDAMRAAQDLQLATSGAGLSEERAAINLQRARDALANAQQSGLGGLDLQEKDLDVREAAQSLAEAQNRYKNLQEDSAEWAKTGVAGSDQVRSAMRSLQAAQDAVGDSARQVARAQSDGARQVEDAQIALATAAQQAGWAQEDAAKGVADAQLALQQAQQQALWANQDAAAAVVDAQRALADAYTDAGAKGAAGANQTAYAMSKLSPAGREFVKFLTGQWQPAIERVSHASAEVLLPKVETALRNVLGLEPLVTTAMQDTAGVVGDLAARGSELATSAPFQANYATILSANADQLGSYGDAGLNMFGAMTDLLAVASPYASAFARVVDYNSQAFESWVLSARASGELDTILRNGQSTLDWLVGELVQIGTGLYNTAAGFVPLGAAAITTLADLTTFIGNLASWNPTLTSVIAGTALTAIGIGKISAAIAVANTTGWIGGLRNAAGVLTTLLNPAALYSSTALSNVRDGFTAAGSMAGGFTRNVTGSSTAAGKVDSAVRGAGRALTGFTAALPLAAVATIGLSALVDGLTTSVSEAEAGLLKGGAAARASQADIAYNDATIQDTTDHYWGWIAAVQRWVNENVFGMATSQSVRAEDEKRRAGMTDLQRAQEDLTKAQGDYEQAMRDSNGQTTPATIAAHDRLVEASGRVEKAQDDQRRAVMSATDALRDQQDTMVSGINARLQYESSVRSTQRAQEEYARVLRETPGDAGAVADALNNLQQAQVRQFEAAQKAGEAAAKANPSLDANAESNRRAAQAVGEMVAATQGELSPALAEMVQHLDAGGLAAAGARIEIDKAGQAVAIFPNGKTVVLNANISPAAQQAQQLRDQINGMVGSIRVDANGQPADDASRALVGRINDTIAQMKIAGDPGPGDGSLFALAQRVRATSEAMHVGGDTVPAQNDTEGLKRYVAAQWAKINDAANTDPARLDTLNRMGWVNGQWAKINVGAETSQMFRDVGFAIQHLPGISPLTPINLFYAMQPAGRAPGDLSPRRAGGGLVDGYAGGGRVRAGARPAGAARPTGSDNTMANLRIGEFVTRDVATSAVGLEAMAAINAITSPRDGAAVSQAVLAALNVGSPTVQGMASGRPAPTGSLTEGYAGGGAIRMDTIPAPTMHTYDLAASVVGKPAEPAADERSVRSDRGGLTVNQTFTDSAVSARDGFDAANRASWLSEYGGVHS